MKILNKEVDIEVNNQGEFDRRSLQALIDNELVYMEAGNIYFYSQKYRDYIHCCRLGQVSIDEVVMLTLEKILEHETPNPYSSFNSKKSLKKRWEVV